MKNHFLFFILSTMSNALFAPIEKITDIAFFQRLEHHHLAYMQHGNEDRFFLLGPPIRNMKIPEGIMQNFYTETALTDSFFVRKLRVVKEKKGTKRTISETTEQWLQVYTYEDVEKLAAIIVPSDIWFEIFVLRAETEMPDAPTDIEDIE